MFDDILKQKPSGMICCATCINGGIGTNCKFNHECFNMGETMIYKDFERFNPVYKYSKWEFNNATEI